MQGGQRFFVQAGDHRLALKFRQNSRARRCILRLTSDGFALVTLPKGVSREEGNIFAQSCSEWLRKQLVRRANKTWQAGQLVPWRGSLESIVVDTKQQDCLPVTLVRFGNESFKVRGAIADLRSAVEMFIRRIAERELPSRVWALAARNGFTISRVTIRNQRSRWGSCSRNGTISLNWRLVQCPSEVIDYIVLHELAHLKHMNHSASFWMEVGRLCPAYHRAEAWLKTTGKQWFQVD